MKKALITGLSGQDGSYLAEYLVELGYSVYGLVRRESATMRWLQKVHDKVEILYGDMRDQVALEVAFAKASPDEVYNLAGQVFVPTSWHLPAETFDINVGGLARMLNIVERLKPDTRVYQASSSEMYGNLNGLRNEDTPLNPTSPYGVSKTAAHKLCDVYRARGIFAVGGILFNHESPRRGPEMVTRKITLASADWAKGKKNKVKLGNMQARRDWGFAGDYVRAMHAMLQQEKPVDYVIATGTSHSVYEFVVEVLRSLNLIPAGADVAQVVNEYVEVDPKLFRTGEIHDLRGDAAQARSALNWKPEVDFSGLVRMMVESDAGIAANQSAKPQFAGKA
ncbi:MAG TPA: GDP-mannose 4,6-dehydratase [Verrucomicrobiae bacterium]|jgi:GDPmannose 4,6-dehydratase|nr:GDP-mannose 4,6-dehydratase [Verrucomicrobiae bacterium]